MVHAFLSIALRSPLRERGLEVMVHTRDDVLITFGPRANVPANYLEFLGLFDRLLSAGAVGEGDATISAGRSTFVQAVEGRKVIALSPDGRRVGLREALLNKDEGWVAVVGGFTEGDFTSPVHERAEEKVSLGDELLTVPLVLCKILGALE